MTKKIFAMFLAVLMVVSMLPTSVFAADCPAEHTKSNCEYTEVGKTAPNCGNKGYTTYKCNACGDTFVADFVDPVGEHDWKDADPVKETCEVNGSVGGKECKVCHKVVDATPVNEIPDGLKCEYGEWTPATFDCKEGAIQNRYCKHCGGKDPKPQEFKAQDDHKMGAWELKTPATAEAEGLAVKKCLNPNCNYVEEQVVFFDHDHVKNVTLTFVAEQPAKCEETGVNAHWLCRVCGQKLVEKDGDLVVKTDAELEIKTLHAQILDTLNCKTTTYVCDAVVDAKGTKCGEVIKVDAAAAHKYGKWEILTAATCTTDGFQKKTCTVCNVDSKTEIIPALGHLQGEWTVAATCDQYGYTYTYCMRNCGQVKQAEVVKIGETNVSFDLTQGYNILSKPVENVGFYLNMVQGKLNNKSLFFTGAMDGYYFATSDDITKAVKVFLEKVTLESGETAFRMYFNANGVKNYIAVVEVIGDDGRPHINVVFGEYGDKYWTWNEEYKILTTKVGEDSYFLGTRGDKEYTTFSACKISYAAENFLSRMYISNKDGVSLLNITPNTTAGFDNTNHSWKNLTNLTASCMNDVVNSFLCEDCGASKTEKTDKLADHKWDNGTVTKEATCTDKGEKVFKCQCTGCTATKKEEIAAKNHSNLTTEYYNGPVKVFTEPGNHKSPISYKYNECYDCKERVNKHDYKAWADAGKIWDTPEAADAAHDTLTKTATTVAGSCTVVGYETYTCSGCSEIVRVKIPNTGAHFAGYGVEAYKAPTCTENGFSLNFKCVNCGKLVDETKAEGTVTQLPALGHTWKTFTAKEREDLGLGEYKKAPCGEPVYNNWIGYCSVCYPDGITKDQLNAEIAKLSDGNDKNDNIAVQADTTLVDQKTLAGALCTAEVYEMYKCHCGKTHMRGYLKTEVNVNHEWTVDTTKTEKPATHTATGTKYLVCKYCSATKEETLPVLPHKNAAGETFTDHCNDTVTDRHCVLCCKCADKKDHDCTADQKKDVEGVQPCDCVIGKHHGWSEKTYVGSICGDAPYYSEICAYCYETKAVDAEEYWTGALNEKNEKVMAPIFGLGHKPVAADADKYGQYTYVKIVHPEYVWVDGVVVMTEASKVAYEAKYIEYKAATFTTDGFAKFVCADCGKTIEAVLPATAGLGFELKVENANGKDGISEGTLVNVTLYANGNNVEVNNFTLNANFGGMIFVGAQPANDSFAIHVTKPENADGFLKIAANAVNTADKKQQNIVIGENTPIVTMQFIAWGAGKTNVQMNGQAFALNNVKVNCAPKACEIEIKTLLDFNEDTFFMMSDLVQAEAILTGESEKTYDVTVDVDKDGEVTLYDLNLMFEYYVNQFVAGAREELVLNGLSEEHVAIVRQHLNKAEESTKHECIGKYCSYTADEKFDVCPVCKTVQ